MKILAIGAHLDDIEITCGGTLMQAIDNGHQVKAVVLSKSGYKNFDGIVGRTDEDAVSEGKNAMEILRVEDFTVLDFPNKYMQFSGDMVEALDKIISEYDPDMIFTHHPQDTHQDHVAVSHSTIAAARRKNNIYFYEPVYPSGRSYVPFKPQLFIPLLKCQVEDKLEALRMHVTEYNKFGKEDWLKNVEARARFRGSEVGREFAECFEVLRTEFEFKEFI